MLRFEQTGWQEVGIPIVLRSNNERDRFYRRFICGLLLQVFFRVVGITLPFPGFRVIYPLKDYFSPMKSSAQAIAL